MCRSRATSDGSLGKTHVDQMSLSSSSSSGSDMDDPCVPHSTPLRLKLKVGALHNVSVCSFTIRIETSDIQKFTQGQMNFNLKRLQGVFLLLLLLFCILEHVSFVKNVCVQFPPFAVPLQLNAQHH